MTLYLVAHKVRSQPAFDIAERMDMGDDEAWWIIPTSGHRAYPYANIPLNNVSSIWIEECPPCPDPWPDHYATPSRSEITVKVDLAEGRSLLESLGLLKPKEPIKRRV